ncbi:HAMP domain-containing sensor histidine kinase [Sphaerisporangium sp. B11E5]|uniref:sensor histidine kinase n=1 Tax=Sphaerisporangium sp. B11E5 TaxID=3153563 RepID=UPI00325D2BD7
MPWRDWSVRTRVAVVAGVLTALVCAGASALVMYGVRGTATAELRHKIADTTLTVGYVAERGLLPAVLPIQAIPAVQVLDQAAGRIISATPRMVGEPTVAARLVPAAGHAMKSAEVCDPAGFRGGCALVVVTRFPRVEGDVLVYGADHAVPWYVSPWLLSLLTLGSIAVTGTAAYGAQRFIRRILRPVDAVRVKLAEVTAGEPSWGLAAPTPREEIGDLADSVNITLDKLRQSVERQRRFASDASHDLRSPLTAMRAQVEEGLLHPADTDWVKTGEALMSSLDRLQAIVTDLLLIARLDAGERIVRGYIDLAELVRTELNHRARRRRVVLGLETGVVVSGDRLQLARLLTNLLDNAERHAVSTVTILVRHENGKAVMEVIDDGEGIASEQREIVFQRFTRLPAGRAKDQQGTGLGLAIAREIAQRHNGTLSLEDSPTGARFVLVIPLLSISAREDEPSA